MKKKRLKQRIRDLEYANRLMFTLLTTLVETLKPRRCQCPMLALRDGMTAEESEWLDRFWIMAMRQDPKTVNREDMTTYYEIFMPDRLKGKLPAYAEAELRDRRRLRIAKVALGLDPTIRDDREDDVDDDDDDETGDEMGDDGVVQ